MAALPSIGRAASVERPVARGADATSDLYERYSGQIFGYCLHQLGSREEAEDAVQTTFMNAFRGLQRGIVPEIESAWLFKIAHNVCLSRRRSSWRRGRVEAPNNLEVLQEVVPARERIGDELIRLHDVATSLKKYGGHDKLADAAAAGVGRAKDKDYVAKLATYPAGRLLDMVRVAEARGAAAAKPAVEAKAKAPAKAKPTKASSKAAASKSA